MGRILIVDDEPAIQVALRLAFEDAGHDPVFAGTGEEALDRLRAEAFDVLLLDKNLPGLNGVDLTRIVRAENPDVPVVMMTAFASVDSAKDTLNLGIDAYIEKPFPDIFDVVRRIEGFLHEGRPRWLPSPGLSRGVTPSDKDPRRVVVPDLPPLHLLIASTDGGRESIAAPIASLPNLHVVYAGEAREVLGGVGAHAPDLVIVDGGCYPSWGLDVVREARALAPEASLVVLATDDPPLGVLKSMIDLGVGGLFDRTLDARYARRLAEIVAGIRLR